MKKTETLVLRNGGKIVFLRDPQPLCGLKGTHFMVNYLYEGVFLEACGSCGWPIDSITKPVEVTDGVSDEEKE